MSWAGKRWLCSLFFCRSGWFQGSVRGFVGLLWWLVPDKTTDGWWTCVAITDIQTLLLFILLILKRLWYARLSIRVKIPLVPLPQINSPWNVNSWMLFTAQLPWTAITFFAALHFVCQGFKNGSTPLWLQMCWTFLPFPPLLFCLQFCLLAPKSEAGYGDAGSRLSARGTEGSSLLSLQGEGVSFSALTVVMWP